MFIEPNIRGERRGWIEVICGSMFSGKTEELIRRLRRAEIAHLRTRIFKPSVDIRFHLQNIVSHNETAVSSLPVDDSRTILEESAGMEVVGIDEAQFFDDHLPDVCDTLAINHIRVIVAGLDMDYTGRPFGQIPFLLARADFITKLHAICVRCGNIANYSYRKKAADTQVLTGGKELYEPRCRECFQLKE
jgi:thymidine kinase